MGVDRLKIILKPILDIGPNILSAVTSDLLDVANLRNSWGKTIVNQLDSYKDNDIMQHIAWQVTGDKKYLENYYGNQIQGADIREYINTGRKFRIDRVYVAERELQRSRIGGVCSFKE